MSISSTIYRNDYTGNGTLAIYSYAFKIFAADELFVATRDTLGNITPLVLNTDYSVQNVGVSAGGTITLLAGNLTNLYHLTIRRGRPLTQETDIRNQGEYYPETVEDTFDQQTMNDQTQQDQIDRSVKLPESYQLSDFNPALPSPILPNAAIFTDPTGKKLVWALGYAGPYRAGGSSAIAAGQTSLAVVFSTPLANSNYALLVSMGNVLDAGPDFQPITYTNKSTTGFTASWSDPTGSANYVIDWAAIANV